MAYDIRKVKNMTDLIGYFSQNLRWNIDVDDFDDIEDISYDFEAEDIGIKEEAFAKISSLRQLQPLVDEQKWGIFCVEFDSDKFEVTALRKILSGLVPKRRNSAGHAVWNQKDLMFICNWGKDNNRTIGIAHFEDKDSGLPQIKMISCAPAMEDFTQIKVFEDRLAQLTFPQNTLDVDAWRESWAAAFVSGYRQTIHDSATLTVQLAAEAQNIRNRILAILEIESPNGYVHLLHEKFRKTLIHDMTESDFADMYAQTVVYGLFSARCMDMSQNDFSAEEAVECIPNTNPFLKSLMQECLGSQNNTKLSFDELEINNVVELLRNTRIEAIIQDFNRQTGGGREDPVIHFYEEFLTAYDKAQKVQRGVYYTPQPVVNFMVRAVDSIIKDQFGLCDGLASEETKKIKVKRRSYKKRTGIGYTEVAELIDVPAIQVLDPATGTGTFLRQTILQIYENFKEKHQGLNVDQLAEKWNEYVPKHLLPRLNGFELMMAPYAVAHMKLAMVLKDTGYDFSDKNRLNVFLANTLEEPGNSEMQMTFFDDPLAIESIEANGVKKNKGINVIIGNPPYSGVSSNNNEFISQLIDDYKYIEGEYFNERKHWLNDDYVKFIRYAENIISEYDNGILAFINNHGFLDNPTFRCMRYHLLKTFDLIYIIDLHGNIMRKEMAPNGDRDENVFDIMQGVSINIFVKTSNVKKQNFAKIYHCDILGTRTHKYKRLLDSDIQYSEIFPQAPYYFFVERDESDSETYANGFCVSDLMQVNVTGIVSMGDTFAFDENPKTLVSRLIELTEDKYTVDKLNETYSLGKNYAEFVYNNRKSLVLDQRNVCKISYRPFDEKYTYFDNKILWRPRTEVMKHMSYDNLAIIIPRQAITDNWSHVGVSRNLVDNRFHYSNKGIPIVYPLYLYSESMGSTVRTPNLNPQILKKISDNLSLPFDATSDGGRVDSFAPSDMLYYIYSVLHSPKYRNKYKEFLKIDFPKVPYPTNLDIFWKMVNFGKYLSNLHLMESDAVNTPVTTYPVHGNNLVAKPVYKKGKVFINKEQYFDGVPELAWNFYIGGYQPLQKWLKDRKGKCLSVDDIAHYQKIVVALIETNKIMQEIDEVFEF